MELQLEKKVFIISGGASGIGAAIVRELIMEGAIPIIVDKSASASQALKSELIKQGGTCLVITKELGNGDVCREVIDEVINEFGKIDGLVNNAGINDGIGVMNGNPKAFMDSLQKNLSHYYDMVHYAFEHLKKTNGSIVNISSKVALTGQGGTSAYAASKGAQLALTREWAVELAPFGIRVNAIVPAEVMTPMYENWIATFDRAKEKLKKITSRIPLGKRMTTPEEIASTAVFLLSDRSSHTTGQWLMVDGGYVNLDRALP